MSKSRNKDDFIYQPFFKGGAEAMKDFIRKNLKYPEEAQKAKIEGTVRINYTIDHKGKVIDTKVISSMGYGCDEEAERLVRSMKFVIPRKPRKLKVKYHKDINIHFRLPQATQITYEVTKSKEQENPKGKTYSYSIDLEVPKKPD